MISTEREIPRPEKYFSDLSIKDAPVYEDFLNDTFKQVNLQFEQVKTVLDLYCGRGVYTLGSLLAFPNAQIHAVDYHKILVPDALNHSRVSFHQGWIADVLSDKDTPVADIVLMIYASEDHGFNEANISLLSSHVGQYLFTVGDNDFIESKPWFRDKFKFLKSRDFISGSVWEAK